MSLSKFQLLDETLALIKQVAVYRLAPSMVFLVDGGNPEALAPRWDELSRHVAAAKLAIIRDEFASRFPLLAVETGSFTFGISDPIVDRYLEFLRQRDPADITNLVINMLDGLFPPVGLFRKRRLPGLPSLGTRLTGTLTAFCQSVERQFAPYAEKFGVSAK